MVLTTQEGDLAQTIRGLSSQLNELTNSVHAVHLALRPRNIEVVEIDREMTARYEQDLLDCIRKFEDSAAPVLEGLGSLIRNQETPNEMISAFAECKTAILTLKETLDYDDVHPAIRGLSKSEKSLGANMNCLYEAKAALGVLPDLLARASSRITGDNSALAPANESISLSNKTIPNGSSLIEKITFLRDLEVPLDAIFLPLGVSIDSLPHALREQFAKRYLELHALCSTAPSVEGKGPNKIPEPLFQKLMALATDINTEKKLISLSTVLNNEEFKQKVKTWFNQGQGKPIFRSLKVRAALKWEGQQRAKDFISRVSNLEQATPLLSGEQMDDRLGIKSQESFPDSLWVHLKDLLSELSDQN